MSRDVQIAVDVTDQFPVFEPDGYSKKTGETAFVVTVWKNGVVQAVSVVVSEIGTSGEYKVVFQPDSIGYWSVQVLVDYNKDIWSGRYDARVGTLDEMYAIIQRIAGLTHENIFIDNTVYDVEGQLTASRTRIFDSKVNCAAATDGGSETTGLLGTYTLETVWAAMNEARTIRQVIE